MPLVVFHIAFGIAVHSQHLLWSKTFADEIVLHQRCNLRILAHHKHLGIFLSAKVLLQPVQPFHTCPQHQFLPIAEGYHRPAFSYGAVI